MPPKVIARNSDRPGVLPVNAAARAAPAKTSSTRLKLEIRRLPPNLTLTEFEEVLGDEWKLGKGKTDWREYRPGKLRAPGKLPEQSRCYIHLANESHVKDFEQRFLSVVFHDKAGTHRNTDLKHLPPTLSFATSQRTPLQVKQRLDSRQGTIDQDPEFIAFLEAETQPLVKPTALLEALGAEKQKGEERVKSTPLIEDLREKKALRAKAAAEKVEKKRVDDKKGANGSKDGATAGAEKDGKATQQARVEQAAKEAAKVLTKQAVAKQQLPSPAQPANAKAASPARTRKTVQSPRQQNATPAAPVTTSTPSPTPAGPAPDRRPPHQRQRGNAEGIKKMLQKDLGIRPKPGPATQSVTTPASQPVATTTTTATSSPAAAPQPVQPPTQPKANPTPLKPTSNAPLPPPQPPPTSLKAYLKHANPSQGMTEMLLHRALAEYGDVVNVTIDPRKGTAIAVFKDTEGLKKAMAARKIVVAKGAVEVLEFRDRGGGERLGVGVGIGPRGGGSVRGRGGLRGGRGGGGGRGGLGSSPVAAAAAGTPAAGTPTVNPPTVSTPVASTPAVGNPVPDPPAASVPNAPAPAGL
ncbi:hypothetical protein LTR35_007064 [Friedmanniomyces endolithicus]|uniref:UPF3 domain-containing protein n=1 Tax=Friedmanniomyces endolithicus TaxID=329885 RepID=A0AAN6FAN5_9PEZI|nr:hypothetical protein LTR35_007064 [Friedmanniomyces endolithicus]KAK0286557.1 hypothetical protein LTS00_010495 [Friedmanniomyces endolithicus]KAK0307055.1 hypothetical protein LTR82_016096 [Friedmanniomyces endolithicus]KAK1017297.1 hypothetical protein LTR54_002674 [Friedmanniomyces endolithicus]